MKSIFIIVFSFVLAQSLKAQIIDPNRAIKRAAERKVNSRIQEGADKAVDKTEEGIINAAKKKKNGSKENDETESSPKSKKKKSGLEEDGGASGTGLGEEENSINFKRGSKLLYSDNFEKDAAGDFPAKWNSSSGGEVKKLKGFEEKFLKVPANSIINLEMTKPLPKNFTIEFDMIFPEASPVVMAGVALGKKLNNIDYLLSGKDHFDVYFYSNSEQRDWDKMFYGTHYNTDNYTLQNLKYSLPLDEKVHIGIMVNNHHRIRVYVEGKKKVDMPKSFDPEFAKYFFFNSVTSGSSATHQAYFYVSNIVIAESGIDERSLVQKDLIENGEFTTNEILFATNSDKIQSSSFDILKQIGQAMESAPAMKFMITGHTDSDGDAAKNQTLSEKRATAVKVYLVENFNVSGANLKTSGKGASDPIASNKTEEGKGKNRRVEFTKL